MDERTGQIEVKPSAAAHRHRGRIAFAGIVLAVLAIVAITPPLVSLNRLQRRIVTSMSQSLGRPVHIDPPIRFHVFPTPGFTLRNFVVSEDPAFGSEPTIRCMNVVASLRLSSLWRRQVEFSKISFEPDENGVGPSLNIVRAANGHYNIESLLLRASHIDAAPTNQKRAGATPRFPYIEARAARVNLKLGDEKMPFSLTGAEFALWLPDAQEWRFQLKATPSRTDANVSDTGLVRVEGSMQRAATLSATPISMTVSWHDAQLGATSRLLTGNDMGWRGTLDADATLSGTFGAAAISTQLTLDQLRRADFVPAGSLDVSATCSGQGDLAAGMIPQAHCDVPTSGVHPLGVTARNFDLRTGHFDSVSIEAAKTPLAWLFGWFKVLSPHTPQGFDPAGSIDASLSADTQGVWTGNAAVTFPASPPPEGTRAAAEPLVLHWQPAVVPKAQPGCTQSLALQPALIPLGAKQSVTVAGSLSACGYNVRVDGTAASAALDSLGQDLPTLAEGIHAILPVASGAQRVDLSCARAWGEPQTCIVEPPPAPARKKGSGRRRRRSGHSD